MLYYSALLVGCWYKKEKDEEGRRSPVLRGRADSEQIV